MRVVTITVALALSAALCVARNGAAAEPTRAEGAAGESARNGWWRDSFEKARAGAVIDEKIVLLLYGRADQKWTKRLREAFSKKALGDDAARVLAVFVEEDRHKEVARLRVSRKCVPTLLLVWPKEERVFLRLEDPRDFEKAGAMVRRALEKEKSAHAWLEKDLACKREGAADDAASLLRLGRFFAEFHEWFEAERTLNRVLAADKDNKDGLALEAAETLVTVGVGRCRAASVRRAATDVRKWAGKDDVGAHELADWGEAYAAQFFERKIDEAADRWEKYLKKYEKGAHRAVALLFLGLCRYAQHRREEAKTLWKRVLHEHADEPAARRAKGFLAGMDVPADVSAPRTEERPKKESK